MASFTPEDTGITARAAALGRRRRRPPSSQAERTRRYLWGKEWGGTVAQIARKLREERG